MKSAPAQCMDIKEDAGSDSPDWERDRLLS